LKNRRQSNKTTPKRKILHRKNDGRHFQPRRGWGRPKSPQSWKFGQYHEKPQETASDFSDLTDFEDDEEDEKDEDQEEEEQEKKNNKEQDIKMAIKKNNKTEEYNVMVVGIEMSCRKPKGS
jgi:hypothetical protein